MKVNKSQHPHSNTLVCTDCIFVFTIHTPTHGNKLILCPLCGDSISVVPFVKDDGTKKEWRAWTKEEYKIIDKVVDGELLTYQVAAVLKRTRQAIQRKVEIRRRERGIIES